MNRFFTLLTFLAPAFALFFIVAQIIVSNQIGILGKDLSDLEAGIRKETLVRQNLATEVASASAMLTIEMQAKALGFREPTKENIVILETSIPVALVQTDRKP